MHQSGPALFGGVGAAARSACCRVRDELLVATLRISAAIPHSIWKRRDTGWMLFERGQHNCTDAAALEFCLTQLTWLTTTVRRVRDWRIGLRRRTPVTPKAAGTRTAAMSRSVFSGQKVRLNHSTPRFYGKPNAPAPKASHAVGRSCLDY